MKSHIPLDTTICYLCGNPATSIMFVDGADWGGQAGYCGCNDSKATAFGSALRQWRLDRRISLHDVVRRMEWAAGVADVSAIESGRRTAMQHEAFALAMELGADAVAWAALAAKDRGEVATLNGLKAP